MPDSHTILALENLCAHRPLKITLPKLGGGILWFFRMEL